MARKPKKEDENKDFLDSDKSLEEQAKLAENLAKEVADHSAKYFEKTAEKLRVNLDKNLTPLQQAINDLNDRQREAEERSKSGSTMDNFLANLANNTGEGKKFDPSTKNLLLNIGKELLDGLGKMFSLYVTKPIDDALKDMSTAYESNFTEIAGRMGTDRQGTYNVMKHAVSTLNSSVYRGAIDANKELIPALKDAAAKGFQGDEAISIALSNSVDKKIMPWLDTLSTAWTNMQFNLTSGQMQSLKAQQLLLQESQSGNRLLQSGVINKIDGELAPILTNIDYNTMDKEKLPEQTKALMEALVDKGMDEDQAYAQAQKMVQIYRDPTAAFRNGGSAADILAAQEVAVNGGDILDAYNVFNSFASQLGNMDTIGAGMASDALIGGAAANGGRRSEDYKQMTLSESDLRKRAEEIGEADESLYQSIADKAAQKVTATQEYDNNLKNSITDMSYYLNEIPHGVEALDIIKDTVASILGLLVSWGIGKVVTGLFGKGGGGTLKNLGSKLFGKGGSGSSSSLKSPGIMSKMLTGGQGFSAAAASGSSQTVLGAGLKTGGLVGGLAQGGAGLTGGAASGATAAGIGAAGLAGGALIAGKGVGTIVDTVQNWDESSTADKTVGLGTGAAMVAGGGMLGAAALGLATGPVGWAGLAIGGVAMGIKALYDYNTKLSGAAEATQAQFEAWGESYKKAKQDEATQMACLINKYNELDSVEDKKRLLMEEGNLSQELVNKYAKQGSAQLDKLAEASLAASMSLSGLAGGQAEALKNEATELMKNQYATAKEGIFNAWATEIQKTGIASPQLLGEMQTFIDSIPDETKRNAVQQDFNYWKQDGKFDLTELKYLFKKAVVGQTLNITQMGGPADANFEDSSFDLMDPAVRAVLKQRNVNVDYGDSDVREKYPNQISDVRNYASIIKTSTDVAEKDIAKESLKEILDSLPQKGEDLYEPLHNALKSYLEGTGLSYSKGTSWVPEDMLALVHQGEMIIPEQQARQLIKSNLGETTSQLADSRRSTSKILQALSELSSLLQRLFEGKINESHSEESRKDKLSSDDIEAEGISKWNHGLMKELVSNVNDDNVKEEESPLLQESRIEKELVTKLNEINSGEDTVRNQEELDIDKTIIGKLRELNDPQEDTSSLNENNIQELLTTKLNDSRLADEKIRGLNEIDIGKDLVSKLNDATVEKEDATKLNDIRIPDEKSRNLEHADINKNLISKLNEPKVEKEDATKLNIVSIFKDLIKKFQDISFEKDPQLDSNVQELGVISQDLQGFLTPSTSVQDIIDPRLEQLNAVPKKSASELKELSALDIVNAIITQGNNTNETLKKILTVLSTPSKKDVFVSSSRVDPSIIGMTPSTANYKAIFSN